MSEDLNNDFAAGSAQESYTRNHTEIQRRQQITQSGEQQNPRNFERVPNTPEMPFYIDAQTHFVWSASHDGMAPRSQDAHHPAVRIYGTFGSHEEAAEHARVVASVDSTCSLIVSPTHKWVMVPKNPDRLAASDTHIEAVLGAHKEAREKSTMSFRENVQNKRGGTGLVDNKAPKETKTAQKTDVAFAPRRLGRDAEVRDQSIVAATFLKDTTQPVGEPIFMVYAAFDNTTTGDVWARCAGDHVLDYDIDLVSTCEWLFVNDVSNEDFGQEIYRSNELNAIMANQKKQPRLVENFKKWRDESESEA